MYLHMGVLIDNRPHRARAGAARKCAAPSPWLSAGGKKSTTSTPESCGAIWRHPHTRFFHTPDRGFFLSREDGIVLKKPRVWLRLVDLSQIPIGTFFREVHPDPEVACQNRKIVTFVAFRGESCSGRYETVRPQALLRLAAGLVVRFCWVFGGWLAHAPPSRRSR